MDRRFITTSIAANVRGAMRGGSAHAISEAAGLTVPDLTSRLDGDEEFTVDELVRVGGFLRVHPSTLLEGVNA